MASSSSSARHGSSNQESDREKEQREAMERILNLPEEHYYEILDIPEMGETSAINIAYKNLSALVHPNNNRGKGLDKEFKTASERLAKACKKVGGDIQEGGEFHPDADKETAGDNKNSSDGPRPREEHPPAPDGYHKKIYDEATPTIQSLMMYPSDEHLKGEIEKHNARIVDHNQACDKPRNEWNDNTIKLESLIPHYQIFANLCKKTDTRGNRAALRKVNDTLSDINTRFGYPETWIAEALPKWPRDDTEISSEAGKGKSAVNQAPGQGATENSSEAGKGKSAANQAPGQGATENSSEAGKGKSAANQAPGQGATENSSEPGKGKSAAGQADAADPHDPDPSFRGVRTRYNEPILGWRKVGRDGRQYLVQKGSAEHPAFELRSQAGDDDGVGRKAGRLYEASPDAVQLGVIDKNITKDDADRYVRVTGVAYKPLQAVSPYSNQLPVTVARVEFKKPFAVHWVFRTTLRRVAGKRDADLDIHDWSRKHGFVPSDEAPPRKILIDHNLYASAFLGRASVLPGRARATMKADDDDEAWPEKEIKTLTDEKEIKTLADGQEELRTRLDKLEKETKDQHKSLSDQMVDMQKNMTEQIAALIAKAVADMMSAQKAQTS